MEADREGKGLPWTVAHPDEGMLDALRIYTQASKVAISRDGTITHRYGFGKGDYETWQDLFEDISSN